MVENQIIIIDNTASRKTEKTKSLIENVSRKIMFLPPYFSVFNPCRILIGLY